MSIEQPAPENNSDWTNSKIEPEFDTVREFSKEHYPERRKKRAGTIREKRKSYFDDKERSRESATEQLPEREQDKLRILEDIKATEASLERNAKILRLSIF